MSNLSCLLDVFHVGEEFVNKVNKKRNILKKGVSFSFSNYGLFIENSLFKELNKRFVNPHDLKYFNKDTHDRWIYGYFSDNGGRHVLFSEVEEKYFILLKIPKYSLEITIPLMILMTHLITKN